MANRPIPVATANAMMQAYVTYLEGLGVDPGQQTQSVSFGSTALMEWMQGIQEYTDEFRICFGVYPESAENRITTIVWPYYEGNPARDGEEQEIEPFNEGHGQP